MSKIKWAFTCINNINNFLFYSITISTQAIRFIQHTQRDTPAEPQKGPFQSTTCSSLHRILKGKKLSRKVKYIPVTVDLFFSCGPKCPAEIWGRGRGGLNKLEKTAPPLKKKKYKSEIFSE